MHYHTSRENLKIRDAVVQDIPLILHFIKETAEYEKLGDTVIATEESLTKAIFHDKNVEVIIAELNNEPIGYALYFYNFSTFTGQSGLYLEDIFVKESVRGTGIGKILFKCVVNIARKKNCITMDWACLTWNKPSIKFYESLGAHKLTEWTNFRLAKTEMESLIK